MKVVINTCYGGFGLSPEALLKLWERGAVKATPVADYFREGDDTSLRLSKALATWRAYQATGKEDLFLTVFTPDEQGVLYERFYDDRSNPELVRIVEEMGEQANGRFASLKVVEIPDDVMYLIDEYDGMEHIAEKHRTWS